MAMRPAPSYPRVLLRPGDMLDGMLVVSVEAKPVIWDCITGTRLCVWSNGSSEFRCFFLAARRPTTQEHFDLRAIFQPSIYAYDFYYVDHRGRLTTW